MGIGDVVNRESDKPGEEVSDEIVVEKVAPEVKKRRLHKHLAGSESKKLKFDDVVGRISNESGEVKHVGDPGPRT